MVIVVIWVAALYILDADHAFGGWHLVEVGCVANASEEHTASIMRAQVKCVGK